jgi:hypothetical protein
MNLKEGILLFPKIFHLFKKVTIQYLLNLEQDDYDCNYYLVTFSDQNMTDKLLEMEFDINSHPVLVLPLLQNVLN